MKILVTGGAGFIASHVVDLYLQHGHEVVVVDNLSAGRRSNLNPAASFYQVDIRSPELAKVFETERPDIVNHHAAHVDVRQSVADPLYDTEVNVLGSLNVLECARRSGVQKVIYISTSGAVFGEPLYLPCDDAHPINPLSPYGASKHTVEHYLWMYKVNHGLRYVVLRYPNVYGPRQFPFGEGGVVAIFAARMLRDQPVVIHGDGEQLRDYVYVQDCARGNLLALNAAEAAGIYNLGSGRGTSVNQLFGALQGLTGYQRDPVHSPAKVGETRAIYVDAARAKRELGWEPEVSLDDGLRQVVAYVREKEAAGE